MYIIYLFIYISGLAVAAGALGRRRGAGARTKYVITLHSIATQYSVL